MSDDPLRELLSSPLDPGRTRSKGGGERPKAARPTGTASHGNGPWLVAAILTGAIVVVAGYLIAGDEGSTTTTTEGTPTTTTTALVPVGALPAGYTAVDDRYGMKVERVLVRPDAVFVSLSSVVPNSLAPGVSSGYGGGVWSLELAGGRQITSIGESTNVEAPGFVSVQFPAGDYTAEDIVGVVLRGAAHRDSQQITVRSAEPFSLPADGTTLTVPLSGSRTNLDAGVDVEFSDLTISTTIATATWTLTGSDTEARAHVSADLALVNEDVAVVEHTNWRSDVSFGFFFEVFGTTPQTREGTMIFDPVPDGAVVRGFSPDVPFTADFTLSIEWTVYEPNSTTIPVGDDAQVVEVG